MIIIYSFPRSGSSILHRTLVNVLNYNSVFEPFGYMPQKITDIQNYNFVKKWFRSAPDGKNINQYKIKNFYISSVPGNQYNCSEIAPYKLELSKYFRNIYNAYGEKTIVKLVRQQTNIVFIHKILVELGIKPKYIFLKRNPVEIVYSFYRGGCYHSFMPWFYKNLCEYKKQIYKDATIFNLADNPIDNLFAAVICDYKSFDKSFTWLSSSGYYSLIIHYEDFIADPGQVIRSIFDNLLRESNTSFDDSDIKNKLELSKLNSSRYDYFFNKMLSSSNNRLKLGLSIPFEKKSFRYTCVRNSLYNNLLFHYPLRIFEAILRRIYWLTKWQIIKPLINY